MCIENDWKNDDDNNILWTHANIEFPHRNGNEFINNSEWIKLVLCLHCNYFIDSEFREWKKDREREIELERVRWKKLVIFSLLFSYI